jgi:archaellum component FlaC
MGETTAEIANLIRDSLGKLERLDERTKMIQTEQADLRKDIKELKDELYDEVKEVRLLAQSELSAFSKKTSEDFVKKTEFEPIKRFVYGVVGFILVAVGSVFFTLLK